jgi:hypothetical protein
MKKNITVLLLLLYNSSVIKADNFTTNAGQTYINTATFLVTRILACVAHEAAHYAAAKALNAHNITINLQPSIVGSTRFQMDDRAAGRIALIHAAGPLAEFLFSYGMLKFAQKLPQSLNGVLGIKCGAISGIITSIANAIPYKMKGAEGASDGYLIQEALWTKRNNPS